MQEKRIFYEFTLSIVDQVSSKFRLEGIDVLDIDVLKSQVLELHGRELQDQLGLTRGILISNLLDLAQDESFHLYRMEAKPLGKLEALLEGDDPRFKQIAAREALVHFRVFDRVVFVGK